MTRSASPKAGTADRLAMPREDLTNSSCAIPARTGPEARPETSAEPPGPTGDKTGRSPTSEATLTEEDCRNFPEEVLFALRNPPKGDRITIWRDGTWKRWPAMDAINARAEGDWLSEIPTAELSLPADTTTGTPEDSR